MTSDQKNQLIKDCLKVCDIDLSEKQVDLIAGTVRLVDDKGENLKLSDLQEIRKKNDLKNYQESKK